MNTLKLYRADFICCDQMHLIYSHNYYVCDQCGMVHEEYLRLEESRLQHENRPLFKNMIIQFKHYTDRTEHYRMQYHIIELNRIAHNLQLSRLIMNDAKRTLKIYIDSLEDNHRCITDISKYILYFSCRRFNYYISFDQLDISYDSKKYFLIEQYYKDITIQQRIRQEIYHTLNDLKLNSFLIDCINLVSQYYNINKSVRVISNSIIYKICHKKGVMIRRKDLNSNIINL